VAVSVLLGRAAETTAIDAALAAARDGRGRLLAFVGEPGIGKTRLADEASLRARAGGFRIAWGRIWDGAGTPPGWPWTQVIRELVEQGVPLAASDHAELAPLLPEIATTSRPEPEAGFRTLDGLLRLIRRAARGGPWVLVLDDVHAADRFTLLGLQLVARALRDLPLVAIVTYREVEARIRPDIQSLLEPIAREGDRFTLGRLTEREVASLLEAQAGAAASASARAIFHTTEGNPFYVHEVARLIARGSTPPHRFEGLLPEGVRAVVTDHLDRLSPSTRAILGAAALVGREFSRAGLCAVTGAHEDSVHAALAEASAAGVITPSGDRASFTHILLADALVDALAPSERARLHGAIASWWRSRSDGDAGLSQIAHHLLEARGDAAEAIGLARRAAAQALRCLAFDRAAELYARALARVPDLREGERVGIELLIGRGEALARSGAFDQGIRLCKEGAIRARAIGAADLEARAALASAALFNYHAPDPDVVSLLERALEALGTANDGLRARVLAMLSSALFPSPEPSLTLDLAGEAVAIARRLGDPKVLLSVLHDASIGALGMAMRAPEREALGREMATLARALDEPAAAVRGESAEAIARIERGELDDVDQRMRSLDRLLGAGGPSQERGVLCLFRGMHARMQGRFDEADACVEESLLVTLPEDAPRSRALHVWAQAYTRGSQRDLEAARALGEIPIPAGGSVWVAAALGEVEEARRRLAAVRPSGDQAWPSMVAVLADACLLAADPVAAGTFHPLLLRAQGEMLTLGPVISLGPADRILAGLAALRGERAAAPPLFESAISLCERGGAMPFLARTLTEYGRFLLDDDPARAGELLARARSLAGKLGMERLAAGIEHLGRPLHAAPVLPGAEAQLSIRRDAGEYVLSLGAAGEVRLKESKGLAYLDELVRAPHREIHVVQLIQLGAGPAELGDSGPMIDATARRQYASRLEDLEEELREAESFGDASRAARLGREIEALADELARTVGRGGRGRRAGSLTERARINVQRRLRDVITRAARSAPAIGRYLEATIKTGTFCSYCPLPGTA
jgi:tetratricopeptide (TPR) repeat protein